MKEDKMKTVTLKNSFHNTEITIRVPEGWIDFEGGLPLWDEIQLASHVSTSGSPDKRRENKIRRALCGMADCSCGTVR